MKRILITGASSGIGLAVARLFLKQGEQVTAIARDFSRTNCDALQKVSLDLSQLDELPSRLNDDELLNQDFDCLILNAGYGRFGGIEQFSHQQIRHLFDTNVVSNFYLLKHYLPKFKLDGAKDIVLIGSEAAISGAKQGSLYCASKFAIRGLAQSLRADCAKADVRVILVNPGAVNSDFFEDLHFKPKEGDDYSINSETVATTIINALDTPRNTVIEEINLQAIKRSFIKK